MHAQSKLSFYHTDQPQSFLYLDTSKLLDHTGTQNSPHDTDNTDNHTKAHLGPQSSASGRVAGSRGRRSGTGGRAGRRGTRLGGSFRGSSRSGRGGRGREVAGKGRRVNGGSGRDLGNDNVSHQLRKRFAEKKVDVQ